VPRAGVFTFVSNVPVWHSLLASSVRCCSGRAGFINFVPPVCSYECDGRPYRLWIRVSGLEFLRPAKPFPAIRISGHALSWILPSSEVKKQRNKKLKGVTPAQAQVSGGGRQSSFFLARSRNFYIALAVFLAARAYILFYADIKGSTVFEVNVSFAYCAQYANAHGASFYQTVRDLKFARDPHRDPIEYAVEYPPLAVGWMLLPDLFLPRITDTPQQGVLHDYVQGNRAAMALADLAGFLLLAAALPVMIVRGARDPHYEWRLLLYTAAGLLLMHILYDRFDLVVGVLILAALRLLAGRIHYIWSFAVLAVAINFKLTPLVLAPIWIFGSLPASLFAGLRWNGAGLTRLAVKVLERLAVLLALTVAMFLPFYWASGKDTLALFAYHSRRGLEIESTWAWLAMIAGHLFHIPTATVSSFGALNVASRITPMLTKAAPLMTLALLVCGSVALLLALQARSARAGAAVEPTATAAQTAPDLFTAYTVLFLLLSIVSSGVLSPQYLLWLVPVVPLLAPQGRFVNFFLAAFLGICFFTTLVFPFAWQQEFNHAASLNPLVYRSPGPLGLTLLSIRNLSMLLVTASTAVWCLREVRSRPTAASPATIAIRK
jgi:hypothetical protein